MLTWAEKVDLWKLQAQEIGVDREVVDEIINVGGRSFMKIPAEVGFADSQEKPIVPVKKLVLVGPSNALKGHPKAPNFTCHTL